MADEEHSEDERLHAILRQLLSAFEWQVFRRHQAGMSYQEIATELQCTPKAIDNALARIQRKFAHRTGS